MADQYARYYLRPQAYVGEHSAVFALSPEWTWAMIRGGNGNKDKLTDIEFKGTPHQAALRLKVPTSNDPLAKAIYEVIFGKAGIDPNSPEFKAAGQPAKTAGGIDDTKLAMDRDPPPPPWLIWEFASPVNTKG